MNTNNQILDRTAEIYYIILCVIPRGDKTRKHGTKQLKQIPTTLELRILNDKLSSLCSLNNFKKTFNSICAQENFNESFDKNSYTMFCIGTTYTLIFGNTITDA